MGTVRPRILGHKDVHIICCQRPVSKVYGTIKSASCKYIPTFVHGNLYLQIISCTSESFRPEVGAVYSRVLGHEDVTGSRADQHPAAKVHGTLEITAHQYIPISIHGYPRSFVTVRTPESLRPEVGAVHSRILGHENVAGSSAGQHTAAKIHVLTETAGYQYVPIPVYGYRFTKIKARTSKSLQPQQSAGVCRYSDCRRSRFRCVSHAPGLDRNRVRVRYSRRSCITAAGGDRAYGCITPDNIIHTPCDRPVRSTGNRHRKLLRIVGSYIGNGWRDTYGNRF